MFTLKCSFSMLAVLPGLTLLITPVHIACAENGSWSTTGILQSYVQTYDGPITRQGAFSAGARVNADYLDSGGFGLGYIYTFVDFDNNAELSEHLYNFSGRYHIYLDAFPGKLTLRLDGYFGEDTMSYNINNPPGHTGGGGMGGMGGSMSANVTETTDITAYQPQLSFINYVKTFYFDIGYAYSEYTGTAKTEVYQFTPTIGFGWNESYDWLQLRGYLIDIDESVPVYTDDKFNSLEIKYTHWVGDDNSSSLEFVRLTGLIGERLLAIDADASVIYSTADKQTGSLSASMQWKIAQAKKLLALVNYSQYENESVNGKYDSLLFYLNLQFHL